MYIRLLVPVLFLLGSLLSGCASPTKMAFDPELTTPLEPDKPVYLMTFTIKNKYRPDYQPNLLVVNVEKAIVNGSEDRINFTMDDKAKAETDNVATGNTYYLRMPLARGDYIIRGFTSLYRSFPIIASFFAPLHADVKANGSGMYYLGHVDATVNERQGDEFRAGSPIPLIDQSVAGASGGSFDIVVSDQWQRDWPIFQQRFPQLTSAQVEKAILPAFDRAKAQKWWEDN
ncbi:hypothetical protein [Sulfuriflexus mobilis]|uniref:hypothetical protein n=1 Tax=Sulfuriflexus mobilis TaxID=1811807 RepID=UPI000F823B30|nr:hypothetical protein [Sulfuriflexus mobilis]